MSDFADYTLDLYILVFVVLPALGCFAGGYCILKILTTLERRK